MHVSAIKPLAKSLAVTADGKEYLAKKDSGITAGMNIEAQIETSEYNGKTYHWIKKWKASGNGQSGQVATTPNVAPFTAPLWGNFVSNQVAHAIQAGLITDPSQIKLWAAAAKQAFVELA